MCSGELVTATDSIVYEVSVITHDYSSSTLKSSLINCVSRATNPCNAEEKTEPQNQNFIIQHTFEIWSEKYGLPYVKVFELDCGSIFPI